MSLHNILTTTERIEILFFIVYNGSYESSRQVPVIGDLRHRNLKVLKIAKTKVLKQTRKTKNCLPKLSLISVFIDLSLSEGRPHRISDDSANQRRP